MKKTEPSAAATGARMSTEAAGLVRQALCDETSGLDRMTNARLCIVKLFARIDRLSGQIDAAFAGQPFMSHLAPDTPANLRRCKTYIRLHVENTKLLERAIRLWMLSYGMKLEDDWSPILVEHMRLQYAERKSQSASSCERANGCPRSTIHDSPSNVDRNEKKN